MAQDHLRGKSIARQPWRAGSKKRDELISDYRHGPRNLEFMLSLTSHYACAVDTCMHGSHGEEVLMPSILQPKYMVIS